MRFSFNCCPDGVRKTLISALVEVIALSNGSGIKTIPGPPPYGASSTCLYVPMPKSLRFVEFIATKLFFNA